MSTALVKPVGDRCNLQCAYCFYRPGTGEGAAVMSERVLAATIERFLADDTSPAVFAWQGGEPTLAGVEFYRTAVALQQRAARGRRVANAFQTNGVLIDETWASFLAEHHFLVGLSIDGPADLHDAQRRTRGGEGSHARAVRAWQRLRAHGAEVNILTVVHRDTCHRAGEVYGYLTDALGAQYLQFIPHIPGPGEHDPEPSDYGRFLVEVYELWARETRPISVKLFDDLVLFLAGKPMRDCMHRGECDSHLVVECDGSVYPCDFFVDEAHRLGSVTTHSVAQLRGTEIAAAFRRRKHEHRPAECATCRHVDICQAGCCRFREGGHAQLCADLQLFLDQCRAPMEAMAARIRARWRQAGRSA